MRIFFTVYSVKKVLDIVNIWRLQLFDGKGGSTAAR